MTKALKKHTLVWIDYEDGSDLCIGYRDECEKYDKIVSGPEMTLEQIADFCDLNAENRNNHSTIGIHRLIATILYRKLGRNIATEILQDIAEYGGLDEMNQSSKIFKNFGISEPWDDWKLV
jgi:hypothetical protein